jgi:hypothetical protein
VSIVEARIINCGTPCNGPGKGLYGASRDVVEGLLVRHGPSGRMNGNQQLAGFLALGLECLFCHFREHPSKSPDFGYFLKESGPDACELIGEEGNIIEFKAPLIDQQAEQLLELCYLYGKGLRVVAAGLLKMLAEDTGAHPDLISYDVLRRIQPKLDEEVQGLMIGLSEGAAKGILRHAAVHVLQVDAALFGKDNKIGQSYRGHRRGAE